MPRSKWYLNTIAEHQLSTINFLVPGKPMMEMIENQVYLAQGAYTKVIGCIGGTACRVRGNALRAGRAAYPHSDRDGL